MSLVAKRSLLSDSRSWSMPMRWSGGISRFRSVAAVPTQLKMHTSS